MKTFQSKSLLESRTVGLLKGLTLLFLGASVAILTTYGLNIDSSINNSVQYIQKIILTNDGTNSGTTGVVIDGNGSLDVSGSARFSQGISATKYCDAVGAHCVLPSTILTGIPNNTLKTLQLNGGNNGADNEVLKNTSLAGVAGSNIYSNAGNIGIGTTGPLAKLDVAGNVKINQSSTLCDDNHRGEMEYDGACFQGCTPSGWVPLNDCTAGVCGATNGTSSYTLSAGDCAVGSTYGNFTVHTTNRTWTCTANLQATNCSANKKIDGICNVVDMSCSAGSFSNFQCNDTPHGAQHTWDCVGINGGTSDNCLETDVGSCAG